MVAVEFAALRGVNKLEGTAEEDEEDEADGARRVDDETEAEIEEAAGDSKADALLARLEADAALAFDVSSLFFLPASAFLLRCIPKRIGNA